MLLEFISLGMILTITRKTIPVEINSLYEYFCYINAKLN